MAEISKIKVKVFSYTFRRKAKYKGISSLLFCLRLKHMFEPMGKNGKIKDNNQSAWWQPALLMFARLSGWIAVPVILATFLGQWLDKKYNSEPWLFLSSVGVAFLISMVGLVKSTLDEYKKISKNDDVKKNSSEKK